MKRSNSLTIFCFLLLFFLFAPTITILIFSFDASGHGTLPLHALSLGWYREVFSSPVIRSAFSASALVGACTASIAVAAGTLGAFALYRHPSRAGLVIITLVALPLALPPLVLGIALLSLFHALNFHLSLVTVTIGHLLITLPVVLLTLNARFSNFDHSLEEAARDLGATPLQTFTRVTLPLIRSSMVGAGLLVLALSLDEFIVTLFTIGGKSTVPVVIWGQMRRGVSPAVNAVSSLLLVMTLLLVLVTRRLTGAAITGRRDE